MNKKKTFLSKIFKSQQNTQKKKEKRRAFRLYTNPLGTSKKIFYLNERIGRITITIQNNPQSLEEIIKQSETK